MGCLSRATPLLAALLVPLTARAGCHRRRLDKVTGHGRTVPLDDGSQRKISARDRSDVATWQQDATITA